MTYVPTPEQLAEWREIGRRTRREQGLPEHITDEVALAHVAALYRDYRKEITCHITTAVHADHAAGSTASTRCTA